MVTVFLFYKLFHELRAVMQYENKVVQQRTSGVVEVLFTAKSLSTNSDGKIYSFWNKTSK